MKKIILAALLFLGLCAPAAAQGTCPYIVYGATLTVAQWQSCFSAKQNVLGYVPVNKAGDTMQGRLVTSLPGATAGFNIQPASVAPASPVNGDMWITPSGFFVRAGGSTIQPYVPTGTSGGVAYFNSTSTLASSALLTSHGVMVGGGVGAAPSTLASLGTTTTILHGNASGNPTFSAVSLTADVSGILPSANGGTNNAFFTVSGPTTSTKTFSFPNASATVLTDNTVVTGAQGGTGVANTGKTITIGGNVSTGSTLSTTGAFSTGGVFSTSSTVSVTGALSTSAALTTTGAGATTLAFGASTQTYTFPTTTATLAGLGIAQSFTANQTINGAALAFSGNISGSGIFGTSGIKIQTTSGTLSDTTSSGTVASNYNNSFGGNTQTATSSTTITNNFGSYFAAPTCSTNVTCTSNWAVGADSLKVTGSGAASASPVQVTGTWYVAGSSTTNYPAMFITATGASIANLNTNGSGLVVNAPSGFSAGGSLLELFANGVSKHFFGANGDMVIQGGLTVQGSGGVFGGNAGQINSTNGAVLANTRGYSWSSTSGSNGTLDTGFYRDSVLGAGNVSLGNGTANNKSGTLNLASITMTGTLTTGVTGGGTQCAQVSNTGVLSGTGAACTSSVPVPTIQKFTTGSGTYTTPAGVRQLYVRMWAGGGGGGSWNGSNNAGTGGTSSFGSTTAIGGSGGNTGSGSVGSGGTGGTGGADTGATSPFRLNGQTGQPGIYNTGGAGQGTASFGGASFGGAGSNASTAMGYGGGGSSGAGFNASVSGSATAGGGGGGGGGEYVEFLVNSPGATISYAVGAGGIASSGGSVNGAAGTGGAILIQERY